MIKNMQREMGRAFLHKRLEKENFVLVAGLEEVRAKKAPSTERKETQRTARNIPFGPWSLRHASPNAGPIVMPMGRLAAYIPIP